MPRNRLLRVLGLIGLGAALGAMGLIASVEFNRRTSTEAFCASCHSMNRLASDPNFQESAHRKNSAGVLVSCGDCHIPKTNWFVETSTHVVSGVRDVIAEFRNNFEDTSVWEARRIVLAHEVRGLMRKEDSITCRGCHDATKIEPRSDRGRAAHALLADAGMTCIDCHFNIVHVPVPPSFEFIRGSRLGGTRK